MSEAYSVTPWVYIKSEPTLWTVGFYDPQGKWHPDSDHASQSEAVKRVHYLNGGEPVQANYAELRKVIIQFLDNRPDDEQGTTKERKQFAPIARRLGELIGVDIEKWGY